MSIITVGVGEEFSAIAAAIAASVDGDVIKVNAGTYTNDFATINDQITLEAVGGVVNLAATEPLPNEKGILIVNNNTTIQGFSFTGAGIPAYQGNNGAGIRYQAGNLTLKNDYFANNQDGLLATPNVTRTGNIDIENSEFAYNGAGDGYSHNIYVNDVASFTFNNSYSHDASVGHDIKSRAQITTITNSRIEDGNGSASYSIDLPNGGTAVINNDVIQQGANSQNPAIIAYGEEGGVYANSSLTVSGNTIVNDLTANTPTGIWNASGTAMTVANNQVYGLTAAQLTSGSATVSGTTFLTSRPVLDTTSNWQPSGTAVPPPPAPTVIGSGPDTVALEVSEDNWLGDAQFTVSVDGNQIGGVQTATASHVLGQDQEFDVEGTFGPGQHTVAVDFLNDAYGGTPSTDRNLYVDSAAYDGVAATGKLVLLSDGSQSLSVGQPLTTGQYPPTVTIGSGPDTVSLLVSEDNWLGDAQFTVSVDGNQIGGVQTAQASHSLGQDQNFLVNGTFGPGQHTVTVNFLNDAYGGTPSTDRNLYIDSATYNSVAATSKLVLLSDGSQSLTVGQYPPTVTIGSGPDTVSLLVSEDNWLGDAQFTVSVDGNQIGGVQTAQASHSLGQDQQCDIEGAFGPGQHSVAVNFLNK